jgi:hypothetical protein
VGRRNRVLSGEEVALMEYACELAFELLHNGIKYRRDIEFVEWGGNILGDVLHYALLKGDKELQALAEKEFEEMIEAAEEKYERDFPEAADLLRLKIKIAKRP